MVPAKFTLCDSVVNFVLTMGHIDGTWWGVERSLNTLGACYWPVTPVKSFGHVQNYLCVGISGDKGKNTL